MEQQANCPKCGNKFASQIGQKSICPKCLFGFIMEETKAGNPAESQNKINDEPILPEGLVIGSYKIVSLLGRGGMGTVYKAHQPSLDRFVAIKILPSRLSADEEFVKRFNREAKTLATLSHPNIIAIYDMGKYDEHYYFVMEYVEGVTVRDLIGQHKLPPEEALKIVPQLCDALEHAHLEGVVHRDIKPDNILIDKKGRIKIADFGLARIVSGDIPIETITKTQDVMGTYDYMSPEQRISTKTVDHRSDIYSMGVVFYEMLTGELPIGKFELPSQKVQVDVRLDEIVLKALAKEPALRYQKASELGEAVTKVTTSPYQEGQFGPTIIEKNTPLDYQTIRTHKISKFLKHLGAYLGVNLFFILMCLTGLMPWVIVTLVAGGWGIAIVIQLFELIIHRYYPTPTEKHSADLLAEEINKKIQQQIAEKSSSDLITQKAQKTAKFLKHLGTYLVINIFLAFLDYITDNKFNWFYWVSACWGAFLALDFVDLIVFRSYPAKVPTGPQEAKHSGLAIAGFVVSFIPLIITQVLGIIFGIAAIHNINRSEGKLAGKGYAIAGIIISIIWVCFFIGACCSWSCNLSNIFESVRGSGNVISETRATDNFNSIELTIGGGTVYLTQDKNQSVKIEADDNLIPLIRTYVKDGVLIIDSKKSFITTKPINIYVNMIEIKRLLVLGSADIIGKSEVISDNLELIGKGSTNMNLQINTKYLKTVIAGAGNIHLSGKTLFHDVLISGSGDLKTVDLVTKKSTIKISGSGNAEVNVSEELNTKISGSGEVRYKGRPKIVNQQITGSGKIHNLTTEEQEK